MRDDVTYPFPNFDDATIQVWESISKSFLTSDLQAGTILLSISIRRNCLRVIFTIILAKYFPMRMTVSVITAKTNMARHSVLYTQLATSAMVWLVLIYTRPYFSKYLIHKFNQSLTTAVKYFMIVNRSLIWNHYRPQTKTRTGCSSPHI